MIESERLFRFKENYNLESDSAEKHDQEFCKRIIAFINDPRIDSTCMVDAYYYDFSVIPRKIQEDLDLWVDQYFLFGITEEGEFVTKWVDRWDLDSDYEVVDGNVTGRKEVVEGTTTISVMPPDISCAFDKNLLSYPTPNLFNKY